MKTPKMPADSLAENIEFGIEIETIVPVSAGIARGGYHCGTQVRSGSDLSGRSIAAPTFEGNAWKAESDSSIRPMSGYMGIEFVSPILKGTAGINAVIEMVRFLNEIGAKVNSSCGCHVTIGVRSLMPGQEVDNETIARFVRRLARFANNHAWAIYAQTGAGRHLNPYSHVLAAESKALFEQMLETKQGYELGALCSRAGRGMVNFRKAFYPGREVVEFRAFAGTLNVGKILHHIATCFGISRKVVASKEVPPFFRSDKIVRLTNAKEAVERLWKVMGWSRKTETHPVALGLFGPLHTEFGEYRKEAIRMAERFESRFPNANL